MLAIFPGLAFVLLYLLWQRQRRDWRQAVLLSALSWGILVAFTTEALSIFQLLTWQGLLVSWLAIDAVLGVSLYRWKPEHPSTPSQEKTRLDLPLKGILISLIVIVGAIGAIAIIAPPNNWDSMTYHMGRVVHWIQNRSVDHYPSNIIRQIYPAPLSSFIVTQLQILSGSDRLANLPQWFSLVGSLIGVSLIARQLGADVRGQVVSAVVCATIPMGILQASSTQNDYVIAFYLVCLAYTIVESIQTKFELLWIAAAGASLGLSLLTKGTAYLYSFPFCLWLVFSSVWRLRLRVWKPMFVFGAIALALNLPHYLRNQQVFGSFLGESGQGLEANGPRIFLSNIIRNVSLHLSTPVRSVNLITIRLVEGIHQIIGIDPSDPRITSPAGQGFDLHSRINHEDLAGNPAQLLLFIAATILLFVATRNLRQRQKYFLTTYWFVVLAGFLMFCLLIIWSPWRSRLHLPIFVLASPFIGTMLAIALRRSLVNLVAIGLLCLSLIWVCFNETRPLIVNSQIVETGRVENIFNQSRSNLYFLPRPDLQAAYTKAAEIIQAEACEMVGLNFGGNTWEYPLWVLLNNHARPHMRIEHVGLQPDNATILKTEEAAYQSFVPCMLIASEVDTVDQSEIAAFNQTYEKQWQEGSLSIFVNSQISIQSSRPSY